MAIDITTLENDASIGGSEKIPVSDAGTPKALTPDLLKTYIIDAIEAVTAATATTGADSVFILQSGVMKPIDIDLVAQHAIDTVWGKAAETVPVGTYVLPLKSGATEKTVTLTVLAEFVRSAVEAAILDVSDLSAAGALSAADVFLVTQGTAGKKVALSAVSTYLYASLAAYVTALAAVTASGGTDVFYCLQGGVEKKATLTQMLAAANVTIPPSTTTENKLPQWDSTSKTLKDGVALVTTLRATGVADDTSVASEKAVRTALEAYSVTSLDIDGATDIGAALADVDLVVVDDGAGGTNRKCAISRFWTYIWGLFTAATPKTTPVDDDGLGIMDSGASNVVKKLTFANMWTNYLAGKAAVAITGTKIDDLTAGDDNTDLNASTSGHGLLLKATAPAAGLMNVVGIANTETAYTNKALFDATTPAAVGTGAVGSAMTAARRDHVHDAIPFVAVDGTLATGANADFAPSKLVYNKTCADSDGDDVIDLHDGTVLGQILTVYLGTKGGSDNAVITPVTALSYDTITLDAANEIATLQWQGAAVGWAILYTNGTVA